MPASRRSNSKPRKILCERIPSAQRIRFGSSGSEVAQAAFRLARAATGKRIILKFEGHYHGWFDNILWSTAPAQNAAGPEDAPVLVPGSVGQDPIDAAGLDVIGWNDLARAGSAAGQGRYRRRDHGAGHVQPGRHRAGAPAIWKARRRPAASMARF